MELHHLRCAIAVAEQETFTRAAAVLHMTQPSLSYVIGRLESELGTPLFERLPRGVRVTAAGEAFLAPARLAVAEADRAAAAVAAVSGLVAGALHLVSIRLAALEVAGHVAAFHERHPDVAVIVDEPTGDQEAIEHVRTGRCDLAVVRSGRVPGSLSSTPLGEQEVVAVIPSGFGAPRGAITLEQLASYPLIAPVAGTPTRANHDEVFAGTTAPRIVAECAHHELVLELVRLGVGASMTSASLAARLPKGDVAVRRLRPGQRSALAIVHRGDALSPAAAAFCAIATSAWP